MRIDVMPLLAVILLGGLLATGAAVATDAVPSATLLWDFNSGLEAKKGSQTLRLMDAQNKQLPADKAVINDRTGGQKELVLNGKSYLLAEYKHAGSLTIRMQVKFISKPQGVLFSRSRPEKGLRGFECGLATEKFYLFTGNRPSATISSGSRDSVVSLLAPASSALKEQKWYDIFYRFEAGRSLKLDVLCCEDKSVAYSGSTSCKEISSLSENAGQHNLAIGGSRVNSSKGMYLLPAGTAIAGVTVWNESLSNAAVEKLSGAKLKAQAPQREAAKLHVRAGFNAKIPDGFSKETAFSSVQEAFNMVRPGDTIILHPGVYYETPVLRVAGTDELPIIITADRTAKDRVVLTAADRNIREGKVEWTLEDEALGLYSIPLGHLPARILYSGTDLMPYPSMEGLRKFILNDGYPGALHGFFYDKGAGKLYVRLHDDELYGSRDPNKHTMCVSPQNAGGFAGTFIHEPEHGNIMLDTRGKNRVTVRGITFETPGAAAVIARGSGVKVSDCWFRGCRFGVYGVNNPENIVVDHCEYANFPVFDDMREIIEKYRGTPVQEKFPIYWWHRKGVHHDNSLMKTYETGIAGGIGKDWKITHNYIHDTFEGISTWCASNSDNLEIASNLFHRLVDNAVETENHSKNMHIHHNDIVDVFEPISWQPLGGLPWPGPVFVYCNRFLTTKQNYNLWPWDSGCFKFGVSGANWQKNPAMGKIPLEQMRSLISKRFVVVPYPGFLVFNNTIIYPNGYLITSPQPLERELVNFKFFNNVIVAKGMSGLNEFQGRLIEYFNNAVYALGDPERAQIMIGEGGILMKNAENMQLENIYAGLINPQPQSPLAGKGSLLFAQEGALPDIGAVRVGGTWATPATGPRTTAEKE